MSKRGFLPFWVTHLWTRSHFSQSNKSFWTWEEQIGLHDNESKTLFFTFFSMLSSGYYLVWGCQRWRLRRAVRGSGLKSLSPWCLMKSCRIINLGRAEFMFCPVRSAPFPSLHWWISHIWVFLFPLHCLINSHKHGLNCVCGGLAGSGSWWRTSCVACVNCKHFYLLC